MRLRRARERRAVISNEEDCEKAKSIACVSQSNHLKENAINRHHTKCAMTKIKRKTLRAQKGKTLTEGASKLPHKCVDQDLFVCLFTMHIL